MQLAPYSYYTVQSAVGKPGGSGYLHVPFARTEETDVTLYTWDPKLGNTDHFEWLLIPVPDAVNTYFIFSRRSALPLRVTDATFAGGNVHLGDPAPPLSGQAVQWVFEPVDDTFRIVNQLTGNYITVQDAKAVANTTPVVCRGTLDRVPEDDAFRRFRLELVESVKQELPAVSDTAQRPPPLLNIRTDLPTSTEAIIRDVDVLPFFAVSDPMYPRWRQVEVSPFYTLSRATLWKNVFDRQLDGIVERETVETTQTGLTSFDAQSVESTLSWAVSAEAEVGYKSFGFSARMKVAAKLAGETKKTTQSSKERTEAHSLTETTLYPAIGKPYRLAKWFPIDRYELRRMDRSLVASWDAVRAEGQVIDVFPKAVQAPERKMAATEADRTARASARKKLAAVV